jgi:plastocyanin
METIAQPSDDWWWITSRRDPSYARGPGDVVVRMTDYDFAPSHMVWRVGERVTLTFVNDTEAHPGNTHEFMMGRGPLEEETQFGVRYGDGFSKDFFDGMSVELSHTADVEMVMPMNAQLTGPDANQDFVMKDMGGMDMGDETGGMDMGDEESQMPSMSPSPEGSMSGMTMSPTPEESMSGMTMSPSPEGTASEEMGGMQGMEEMNGFMVELNPGGAATISFVVPDKPGTWEYGCFAESGQHYANGMKGTVTIVR